MLFFYILFRMKLKNKILLWTALILSLFLFYFFMSFIPLRTELRLIPEWTCDVTKTKENPGNEKVLPFRLGNRAGYFTHSGKIASMISVPYKATLSRDFYALYDSDAENIPLYTSAGEKAAEIQGAGFPFVQENRVFLFMPGGSSLGFVSSADGSVSSVYEGAAPITAFDSSENGSALGFADGELVIFDKNGLAKIFLKPGGSDYEVILGAAISADGRHFACVSGISPQRFVLYSDEGSYEKIIHHEFLESSLTRQTKVQFSKDGSYVYYDTGGALGIAEVQSQKSKSVPIEGTVLDIEESPVGNSVYVLSRTGRKHTVTVFENWNEMAGDFSFDADSGFITADGNTLFVGADNKISRITISKS